MKYLATIAASILLITPFSAFAQTTQEQHDALIMQLITLLTQEVQSLEAQVQAQSATPDTSISAISNQITPITQQLAMPEAQGDIIVHDDTAFYLPNATPNQRAYSIFVQNPDGTYVQDPTQYVTFTVNGTEIARRAMNGVALFDATTAMTAPHNENGIVFQYTFPDANGALTISAAGIDKVVSE